MTKPNEQLIARISEIKRNSEIGMIVAVTENTVHDLLGDIRFLLNVIDQSREELEQLREDRHQNAADMFHDLNTELEQVKAERDSLQLNLDTMVHHFNETTEELEKTYSDLVDLESELSAKDKALEWYGDIDNYNSIGSAPIDKDEGRRARTILSQYEVNE